MHMQCSESFYRECVNEELSRHHTDSESKNKMIEILTKMYKENGENSDNMEELLGSLDETSDMDEEASVDSDDDEYVELKDRIGDLNLDDADAIWNALTEDEKNGFEAFICKGEVSDIVPRWEPWWLYNKKNKLVEDLQDAASKDFEKKALEKCPKLKIVSKLTDLTVNILIYLYFMLVTLAIINL